MSDSPNQLASQSGQPLGLASGEVQTSALPPTLVIQQTLTVEQLLDTLDTMEAEAAVMLVKLFHSMDKEAQEFTLATARSQARRWPRKRPTLRLVNGKVGAAPPAPGEV
jgi:hypothetical protein